MNDRVADQPTRLTRRGRPPLPPAKRRSEVFSIRVTPGEADAIYRYAMRHGATLDAMLRRVLLRLVTGFRTP